MWFSPWLSQCCITNESCITVIIAQTPHLFIATQMVLAVADSIAAVIWQEVTSWACVTIGSKDLVVRNHNVVWVTCWGEIGSVETDVLATLGPAWVGAVVIILTMSLHNFDQQGMNELGPTTGKTKSLTDGLSACVILATTNLSCKIIRRTAFKISERNCDKLLRQIVKQETANMRLLSVVWRSILPD